MTIYYVAKNGNNNNPGTEQQPFLTIQTAINKVEGGDTVFVKAGTYNEKVTINKLGSVGNWITFSAAPGTVKDTVVLDGTNISLHDELDGLIYIKNSKFIKVSGFRVQNSRISGILVIGSTNGGSRWSHITIENNHTYQTRSSGIDAYGGGDNLIIDGNEIERAANDGTYWSQECISVAYEIDTVEVKNNYIHDCSMNGVKGGGEGIDLKDGISNAVVHHNHIWNVEQLGIYIDAYSRHNYNIEVYNNVIHEGKEWGHGIAVGAEDGGIAENIKFYNNLVYNCRNIGFWLMNDNATATIKNISVMNNTFFNNGMSSKNSSAGGILLMASYSGVSNVRVANNIVYNNYAYPIALVGSIPGLLVENNLVFPFKDYGGEIKGINSIEASPLFINTDNENFHLTSNSPAINKGNLTGAPLLDFDGNLRSGNPDIGAYEYTVACVPNWQCEIPRNGYENDGCDHRRLNSACNPVTTTKYKCSGSPDYSCIEDVAGQYDSLTTCRAACKASQPQPDSNDARALLMLVSGMITSYFILIDKKMDEKI